MSTGEVRAIPEDFITDTSVLQGNELAAASEQLSHTMKEGGAQQAPTGGVEGRTTQTYSATVGQDLPEDQSNQPAEKEVAPMPEGGHDKYYNAKTGEYNWPAHAKELEFQRDQARKRGKVTESENTAEGDDAAAQEAVSAAGLNWDDLTAQIATNGDISEEDYAALNAIGIPEEIVRTHVKGVVALAKTTQQEVHTIVGGERNLEALMEWSRNNLSEAEITAFDRQLAGPDWPVALSALMNRAGMSPAAKAPRNLQEFSLAGSAGTQQPQQMVLNTPADITKAMSDPLYNSRTTKGEQYRQMVYAAMNSRNTF